MDLLHISRVLICLPFLSFCLVAGRRHAPWLAGPHRLHPTRGGARLPPAPWRQGTWCRPANPVVLLCNLSMSSAKTHKETRTRGPPSKGENCFQTAELLYSRYPNFSHGIHSGESIGAGTYELSDFNASVRNVRGLFNRLSRIVTLRKSSQQVLSPVAPRTQHTFWQIVVFAHCKLRTSCRLPAFISGYYNSTRKQTG